MKSKQLKTRKGLVRGFGLTQLCFLLKSSIAAVIQKLSAIIKQAYDYYKDMTMTKKTLHL